MTAVSIIFPHQLFEKNPLFKNKNQVFLVEEFLFFKLYNFHKQKIALHRASMKFYEEWLVKQGYNVAYVSSFEDTADVRKLIVQLHSLGVEEIHFVDPTDDWLRRRIAKACNATGVRAVQYATPMFINSVEELHAYYKNRKRFFQTDFYIHQRKKLGLLLEGLQQPAGGKWTYDQDNRLKYPAKKQPPLTKYPAITSYYTEAKSYVEKHFGDNYGELTSEQLHAVTFEETRQWLQQFLEIRFAEFGPYEDAIVASEPILHHSKMTPMLNIGLITPNEIVAAVIEFAAKNEIPLQSTEGYIRQVIGWREFMRALYELKGVEARNRNFWNFSRRIPPQFWTGDTGIPPIDIVIKKVLHYGYCHHIERLMVLGNFMLLCRFHPDDVYKWFMEMFVDAYDWVMVSNIYSMSQFADGGIMATKPYISSSNYIMKMSNFKKGEWQNVWDGLFWSFMNDHRDFFEQNIRLRMLLTSFDRMDGKKKKLLLSNADRYLQKLDELLEQPTA